MKHLQACMDQLFDQQTVRHVAIRVGKGDRILMEYLRGTEQPVSARTRFGMASVTKIEATTMLALMAMERGWFTLETNVSEYLQAEVRSDMTVWNLMTHTMGVGHKNLCQPGFDYSNIENYILSIPADVPIGTDVLYSCPGYILLGKMVEKAWGMRLDEAFTRLIAQPLGMVDTSFLPTGDDIINHNPLEEDRGKVNDYNARYLGGVCGNAGLFSNIEDSTRFAALLQRHGAPLITPETFALAAQNHTPDMREARGLGFLYVDERFAQAGRLMPTGSIGHTGHTGQSILVDPVSGLYAILLSDATISVIRRDGRDLYAKVLAMREMVHNAIYDDLCAAGVFG